MSTSFLVGAVALASALAGLPAAATTTYRLVDLGPYSEALDINHKGQIAGGAPEGGAGLYSHGEWRTKNIRRRSSIAIKIDDAGNMVGQEWGAHDLVYMMYYPRGAKDYTIPMPDGANVGYLYSAAPVGVSPDGMQVVGVFQDVHDGRDHCFLWHPGDLVATDIGLPGGGFSGCEAWDVNDAGQVVGRVEALNAGGAAFVWQNGTFTLVGPQGEKGGELTAVNKKGHAIGDVFASKGWYWDGKELHTIPPSGGLDMTYPTAINERDEIVGRGDGASGLTILKYADGNLVDLVPLIEGAEQWKLADGLPTGIDEHGRISGYCYLVGGGAPHGYVLIPQD